MRKAIPATKPPTCAHHATPPESDDPCPMATAPLRNWMRNQIPRKKYAGISTTVKKMNRGRSVTTFARGNRTRYAPRTPAIAPDAPMLGTIECALKRICTRKDAAPDMK